MPKMKAMKKVAEGRKKSSYAFKPVSLELYRLAQMGATTNDALISSLRHMMSDRPELSGDLAEFERLASEAST